MLNERTETTEIWESVICIVIIITAGFLFCLSSGIITSDPPAEMQNISVNITTIPTPTPEIIYITVTPTPEPIRVFSEWNSGERNQGELFSFRRENVQGLKDMKISTVMYGYKIFDDYEWFSEQYQRYFYEYPSKGNKFIAVYVAQWEDGNTVEDDSSVWGFGQDHYAIQYGNTVYYPDLTYQPMIRIKELELTSNYGENSYIHPYGYDLEYRRNTNATINAGWVAIPRQYIRMGFSNRWDGYIIFQVPKAAQAKDLAVLFDAGTFGSSQWILTAP